MVVSIVSIVLSLAVLLFGRRLFWLFVGGIGFLSGVYFAARVFQGQPEWLVLVIGLVAGVVGAVLAVLLQKVAVAAAGFLAAGSAAVVILGILGTEPGLLGWLGFLVGGVVGALLVLVLFDWALIVLSSLAGAAFLVEAIHWGAVGSAVLFLILFLIGFITQAASYSRARVRAKTAARPNP